MEQNENRMQEVETPVSDTYTEHSVHYLFDKSCSSCHARRALEEEEKVLHKDCRWCRGTLTWYAQDGPDSVTTEICPGISDKYLIELQKNNGN